MRRTSPLVTVLMPVCNGVRHVRGAIDSILQQTFIDFELLIVNDGCVDDTQKILDSYQDPRIRVLINPRNLGMPATLNRGLEQARGRLIAQQDADATSHPTRLSRQVAFLGSHPRIAMVGAQARMQQAGRHSRSSSLLWRASGMGAIRFQALFCNPFLHTSVMYRRALVWDELHGYALDYRIGHVPCAPARESRSPPSWNSRAVDCPH